MPALEIGLVLPMEEAWTDGSTPRWPQIRELATRAEQIGFDCVWIPDELRWRPVGRGDARGWWECVAMAGAVAAATSRIKVGTWVLSALAPEPRASPRRRSETLDEISGGRFVFGPGLRARRPPGARIRPARGPRVPGAIRGGGRAWSRSLLRGGRADFEGTFHAARDLEQRPSGPASRAASRS